MGGGGVLSTKAVEYFYSRYDFLSFFFLLVYGIFAPSSQERVENCTAYIMIMV